MKNRIKIERAKNSMTQSELASKVQVSRQTIYAIEAGEYNLSTLLALKIASVFETSIESLFVLEQKDWK
ncbi:MAG TPA: transcriptional regulator [Crocinitomicaceae bacterium]|nr:transcriptional regulator [Crocinitomicaceae bacterium]